jgi:hypothetical protein
LQASEWIAVLLRNRRTRPKEFTAGKLGVYKPFRDAHSLQVLLGKPLVFTAQNIDQFDF